MFCGVGSQFFGIVSCFTFGNEILTFFVFFAFCSQRQIGFWKPESMPDHCGEYYNFGIPYLFTLFFSENFLLLPVFMTFFM